MSVNVINDTNSRTGTSQMMRRMMNRVISKKYLEKSNAQCGKIWTLSSK